MAVKLRRCSLTESTINILEMLAKQVIERFVLPGILISAEPPEPIAAFRDVQRLKSGRGGFRRRAFALKKFPRLFQQLPAAIFFFLADPGSPINPGAEAFFVYPRAGKRS